MVTVYSLQCYALIFHNRLSIFSRIVTDRPKLQRLVLCACQCHTVEVEKEVERKLERDRFGFEPG